MRIRSLFLVNAALIAVKPLIGFGNQANVPAGDNPPNVIFVLTDDQGYGDLGCHGNPDIKTPFLDQFFEKSLRFTNFHVSPTCTPTRASLMTGRYANRTNTFHTIGGRSILLKTEKILPQVFAENGYATGIFGKWHLGDNYPYRPEDRGFQEVVRHGGGGITQGPDYWGNDYFDDTYYHNSVPRKYEGYCTDVFFDEALKFIERKKNQPFFCFISTNAPHGPLHVPEKYLRLYENEAGILENQKRFYGMITNVDDNFGRLVKKLAELDLERNTILIFMTDNGTAFGVANQNGKQFGFDAGLRGQKSSHYDGGHRVPFFIRWPEGNIGGGRDIDQLTAHIDFLPTLVDLCGLRFVATRPLDGRSLVPLIRNETIDWSDRIVVVDNQRMQNLVRGRNSAVMDNTWRLIDGEELYHIKNDRYQAKNVATQYPEVVARLQEGYNHWWESLLKEGANEHRAYIEVGSDFENPVRISSHDMQTGFLGRAWHQHGPLEAQPAQGVFNIEFLKGGNYRISLHRYPVESGWAINQVIAARERTAEVNNPMPASNNVGFVEAFLYVAGVIETKQIGSDKTGIVFEVDVPQGKYQMEAFFKDTRGIVYPSYFVYVEKL